MAPGGKCEAVCLVEATWDQVSESRVWHLRHRCVVWGNYSVPEFVSSSVKYEQLHHREHPEHTCIILIYVHVSVITLNDLCSP